MFRNQEILFQERKIHYPIDDPTLRFADYIANCRKIVAEHRLDLDYRRELIINANSPYELRPRQSNRCGALLIHGFLDSPSIMRDMGDRLCDQGLLVRSILLPGHGTVPGALLGATHDEWIKTVNYGAQSFQGQVDKLFLVGFSLGGALAYHHALTSFSDFIAGVITICPAFEIRTWLLFLSRWYRAITQNREQAKWVIMRDEMDYAKYRSPCYHAAYEILTLVQKIEKLYRHQLLQCPQFMALTLHDETVNSRKSLHYFSLSTQEKNRLLVYARKPFSTKDSRITVRSSVRPEQRIEDFSHVGMMLAPTNPHYGIHGDYPLASHIDSDTTSRYGEVNPVEEAIHNFLYEKELARYPFHRLTFNPDFDFMMQAISDFIATF